MRRILKLRGCERVGRETVSQSKGEETEPDRSIRNFRCLKTHPFAARNSIGGVFEALKHVKWSVG